MDHLLIKLLEFFVKGLGWVGENFPDDPRLGRKLVLAGGVLASIIFVPDTATEWGDIVLGLRMLCVLAGGACLMLGGFVFFRRWVWRRQDRRAPVTMSLGLK